MVGPGGVMVRRFLSPVRLPVPPLLLNTGQTKSKAAVGHDVGVPTLKCSDQRFVLFE